MKRILVLLLAIGIVFGSVYAIKYVKTDHVSASLEDVVVDVKDGAITIEKPSLLALERREKFADGYCYDIHGFVFPTLESENTPKLFDCYFYDKWKKHVVPFKLDSRLKGDLTISAEMGVVQENKYFSMKPIAEQAELESKQLKDLTETKYYLNINSEKQTIVAYFTDLIKLCESDAFNKIQEIKPGSILTLKISVNNSKKTVDFYFVLDAERIKMSEATN